AATEEQLRLQPALLQLFRRDGIQPGGDLLVRGADIPRACRHLIKGHARFPFALSLQSVCMARAEVHKPRAGPKKIYDQSVRAERSDQADTFLGRARQNCFRTRRNNLASTE